MIFADTALINGKIYSVDKNGKKTDGDTVLIKDGLILKTGIEKDLQNYISADTEVIDCHGNTILPGLCDAHCHPSIAASAYSGCDLFGIYIQEGESGTDIIDKYMKRLKDFVDKNPEEVLIRGTGWVMGNFTADRMPTRHDIDMICSDRPVILESFCQHNLWVNTKAIEIAGISENTPDVYAGKIYREADGFPEGIFNDPEAMNLIKLNVPGYDFSVEKYKEAFLHYQKDYANKYGVTLVQDCMHSDNARTAFKELALEGKLTVRIRGVYLMEPGKADSQLPEAIKRRGMDNVGDDFRIDTVKIFAEGTFSLIDSYDKKFIKENGLPDDYNEPLYWSDEEFTKTAYKAMKAGFDIHVHAMGDNAVRQSAECLSKAQLLLKDKNEGFRNVIAHLMLTRSADMELMAENHIIANCQPRWMVYDSDIEAMVPMIGKKRAENAYPLRALLDRGITVTFGTDFPVTPPPDTMQEIQCAMTRKVFPEAPDYHKFKDMVLGNEKPATLWEAVKALSLNGAYQMSAEDITGSVEAGKSADIAVLDSDIEAVPIDEIYAVKVDKTLFKGKVVYDKDNQIC